MWHWTITGEYKDYWLQVELTIFAGSWIWFSGYKIGQFGYVALNAFCINSRHSHRIIHIRTCIKINSYLFSLLEGRIVELGGIESNGNELWPVNCNGERREFRKAPVASAAPVTSRWQRTSEWNRSKKKPLNKKKRGEKNDKPHGRTSVEMYCHGRPVETRLSRCDATQRHVPSSSPVADSRSDRH